LGVAVLVESVGEILLPTLCLSLHNWSSLVAALVLTLTLPKRHSVLFSERGISYLTFYRGYLTWDWY